MVVGVFLLAAGLCLCVYRCKVAGDEASLFQQMLESEGDDLDFAGGDSVRGSTIAADLSSI
jgi:hypothetical protein